MDGAEHEIVGVVADTRDYGPDTDPFAMAYVPAAQHPVRTLSLVLHTATPPAASADAVRETVRALDPDQPVYDVTTMATIAEQWVSGNMAMVKMLVVMGAIALLL
ncbi:MAG: hypothetical protein GWN71_00180, partial [Gammaproteobacteria bacterium]|nr:hypothetical protein [Gemmatimonadota bacterium]NIU72042.1 hypothetical protein [Gammaproteobacteria bacterium]